MTVTSIHTSPDAAVAPAETPPGCGIADEARLYQLSGLVDVIRDTAKDLLPFDVDQATCTALADRYTQIVTQLPATLDQATRDELTMWAPTLSEDPTIPEVFDAASTLARWIDLRYSTAAFLVNRRQQTAEIGKAHRQLDRTVPDATSEVVRRSEPGQYL